MSRPGEGCRFRHQRLLYGRTQSGIGPAPRLLLPFKQLLEGAGGPTEGDGVSRENRQSLGSTIYPLTYFT